MNRTLQFIRRMTTKKSDMHTHNTQMSSVPDSQTLLKATIYPTILRPYLNRNLQNDDHFGMSELVSIRDLFKARVHYGHKIGTLNEKMKWAIFGERLGVCIFDLAITQAFLVRALEFLAHVAYNDGMILFITSNRDTMLMVEEKATAVGEYAHVRKWQEGTLVNSNISFGTTVRLPDTIILLSTLTSFMETHPAVIEAAKLTIPTIGIVDSNSDPAYISYPIPGNDDTVDSIKYFMDLFVKAIEKGKVAKLTHSNSQSAARQPSL